MQPLYHIGFDDTHGAKYALLPGDPGRVEQIAKYLDNPRFHHQQREYTTWLGEVSGETVMVMSTGMGGPSTAIGVEELYMTGVRNFIRIGTTGGIAMDVTGGDVVIANAAIRMDGTPNEYAPIEFPAVSNIDITNALIAASKKLDLRWHCGVVHCKDSFYGQHSPARMPVSYELEHKWEAWKRAGTLSSEMESSTLYIVSQILGARAGCILNVVWNQERAAAGLENPKISDTTPAIKAAVEAVRILIEQDK